MEGTVKTFQVFRQPIRGHEAVKIGFSWPAFFWGLFGLSVVWLALKRLWVLTAIWFAALVAWWAIGTVMETAETEPAAQTVVYLIIFALYLTLWFLPAFKGHVWRASNLKSRGCELVGQVQASSPDAALADVAKAAL
jgi:hypothetical protein